MSESERRRRKNYKRNRKKWITIQTVAAALLVLLASIFFITYLRITDTYEIPYSENGNISYKVDLLPNDSFDTDTMGEGYSYIAELIDNISAEFQYTANTDSVNPKYKYNYSIIATVEVIDNNTGKQLFVKPFVLKDIVSAEAAGHNLVIDEKINIDFEKYNQIAKNFVTTWGIGNATSRLTVQMETNVTITEEFLNCIGNSRYISEMVIPLTHKTVNVQIAKTSPASEKLLVSDNASSVKNGFLCASLSAGVVALLIILLLTVFILITRNHDINYSIKVKRLLNSYRSYIQILNNEFDTEGYQLLSVNNFTDMLSIRDTVQSPILMKENEDETQTVFIIPTATRLLYLYEIKVDNYDEIYGSVGNESGNSEPREEIAAVVDIDHNENLESVETNENSSNASEQSLFEPEIIATAYEEPLEEVAEEPIETTAEEPFETTVEEPIETTVEEPIETTVEEPIEATVEEPIETTIEEPIEATVEEPIETELSTVIALRYRTTFTSRLIQSTEGVKERYSLIKNYLLSFTGMKARTSLNFETYKSGRINCARLDIKGTHVHLYLALDPQNYNADKYRFRDVKNRAKVANTPMLLKIKSDLTVRLAHDLIDECMSVLGITQGDIGNVNYCPPYETTEELVRRDLIKVLLPAGTKFPASAQTEKLDVSQLLRRARAEADAEEDLENYANEAQENAKKAMLLAKDAKKTIQDAKHIAEIVHEMIEMGSEDTVSEHYDDTTETSDVNDYDIKILTDDISDDELIEAMAAPTPILEQINYIDTNIEQTTTEFKNGVEVIGVVWPERRSKNKVYKYDPNGEILDEGDIVLVPTRDTARQKEVIRKAAVAKGNYTVESEKLNHPLKKIIGVVRRKIENALSSD